MRTVRPARRPPAGAATLVLLALLGAAAGAAATEATFRFRPPEGAAAVTVAGHFNDWNTAADSLADSDGDGVWEARIEIPAGKQPYKFVVNGADWIADPHAAEYVDDGFGGQNSVADIAGDSMTVGEPPGWTPGEGEDGPAAAPAGTEVTFRYRAEGRANAVSLAGSFNGWDAARDLMSEEEGDGVWSATLRLPPGEYAYQYVIDGEEWREDPAASRFEEDGFGGRRTLLAVGNEPLAVGPAR